MSKFIAVILLISTLIIAKESENEIETILIHPIFNEVYACTEHWDGQFKYLGDALGSDCVIQEFVKTDGRLFLRAYKNKGYDNADWYGWQKQVLSPCDCIIEKIYINPKVNKPGIMNPGRATSIIFKMKDGTRITLAHLDKITIKSGDSVKKGQPIAKVGNNGYCRNPHVHIGAWKGEKPLQIRFNQKEYSQASNK